MNQDPKDIKDDKSRKNLIDAQIELKKRYCVEHKRTQEQQEMVNKIYEVFGLRKE